MNKRIASFGVIAGLAVGSGAGLALSQVGGATASVHAAATTDTSTPATDSSTPANPGTSTNIPAARSAWEKAALDKLVTDGTLTQAQADAVVKALDAARPARGAGGPGDRGGMGGGMRGGFGGGPGASLDVAAKAIGITAAELRTDIINGQTVAAVATTKGVTAQAVIDALVADLKTREAAEVTAGTETQAVSDQEIATRTTEITNFVNNTKLPTFGGHGPGGMPGHRGPGSNGSTTATPPTTTA